MPRGSSCFNLESAKKEISPLLLVRILNIPAKNNPSLIESLYFTDWLDGDNPTNVMFFDEKNSPKEYVSCALTYDSASRSTQNEIDQCRLRLDNVDTRFSSLAQRAELNGVEVQVLRGFRSTMHTPDGAAMVFLGHINACVIGEHAIEATITPDFSLRTRIPRRLYWPLEFPYLPSSKDPREVFTG